MVTHVRFTHFIYFNEDNWPINRLRFMENHFNGHVPAEGILIFNRSWTPNPNFFFNLRNPVTSPPQGCENKALVHCKLGVGKPPVGLTWSWAATHFFLQFAFYVHTIVAYHVHAIPRPEKNIFLNTLIHKNTHPCGSKSGAKSIGSPHRTTTPKTV
jgi:hypothetical protein